MRICDLPDLPIKGRLPEIAKCVEENSPLVLVSPPGTGKTMLVAPYLLGTQALRQKKIILLEPRRLAARAAARQMAKILGENVGESVGYQVRLERVIGQSTRIEILTEGLLTQRLLRDPELSDVGLIIFDEFHERSLQADLGLALAMDARGALRPDLRIILMSATIDASAMAQFLGDGARIVRAEAKSWPVTTHYVKRTSSYIDVAMADAVREALLRDEGGILAFLPGEREIRNTEARLLESGLPPNVDLLPLYGALGKGAQDAAMEPPSPGRRKVVLATSIAESSLTIQDVRVVVDCGLMRVSRFSPQSGMSRLETLRITRDRADQRRGRAGRTGPGVCYRLWGENEELISETIPEILDADLARLRLAVADWGAQSIDALSWVTVPPEAAWRKAGDLLRMIGALEGERLTEVGRNIATLPVHPRLGFMILQAQKMGGAGDGALLAAIVEEILGEASLRGEMDLRRIFERVMGEMAFQNEGRISLFWMRRVRDLAASFRRFLPRHRDGARLDVGRMLSWAFPDRIAERRGNGVCRLSSGQNAVLPMESMFGGARYIAVSELQDMGNECVIRQGASVDRADLSADFAEKIVEKEAVRWDRRTDRVVATKRRMLGALALEEFPLSSPSAETVREALCEGIKTKGIMSLNWSDVALSLQARVEFLRRVLPEDGWPDFSFEHLENTLSMWLDLAGITRLCDVKKLDLVSSLERLLMGRRRELDLLAPAVIFLPCGRKARVAYDEGDVPVLSGYLQDFFGMKCLPSFARGRVRAKVSLLSPARRTVAITDNLEDFWQNGYLLVRKEMRGRYPKHNWPENPASFVESRNVKNG